MIENKVIDLIVDYLLENYPQQCPNCGQRFSSLKEYLLCTTPVGKPISYDAEDENWMPEKPVGTFALANCLQCGTTVSLNSVRMSRLHNWLLLNWAKRTTRKRNITISDLLEELRTKIDAKVLGPDIRRLL